MAGGVCGWECGFDFGGDGVSTGQLKAPFPAFGGKSRVAGTVWPRFGAVRNYVEPFCFSAAMLLLRPDEPQIETVNDLNAYVANFWRSIQRDPEAVAEHADWPVNEVDLHARHAWLVRSHEAAEKLQRVRDEPDYFDAKIAGWWCWGACMWIGSGWCDVLEQSLQLPRLGARFDQPDLPGVLNPIATKDKRPQLCNGNTTHGIGVNAQSGSVDWKQRPQLEDSGGRGVLGTEGRPQLADAYSRGRGVHGNDELTDCQRRRLWLIDWFTRLADRLRAVRVCCGHWARVCDSDSTLTRLGTTGVFLDPPYRTKLADGTVNRAEHIYANDKAQDVNALVDEVQEWCLKWGDNRDIRIAVCGLEGEYPKLAHWDCVAWKSRGGYGNRNKDNQNAARERIWFSPHCKQERTLFDAFV